MHYMHYMHYKDYIHDDFYVYSPVLLTQYLGHCWHTEKTHFPCHRGGEPSGWGGCGGPCSYIMVRAMYVNAQTYIYTHLYLSSRKNCVSFNDLFIAKSGMPCPKVIFLFWGQDS